MRSAAKEVVFSLMALAQDLKTIWAKNNQFHNQPRKLIQNSIFPLYKFISVTARFPSSLQGIKIVSATWGGYPLIT